MGRACEDACRAVHAHRSRVDQPGCRGGDMQVPSAQEGPREKSASAPGLPRVRGQYVLNGLEESFYRVSVLNLHWSP